jgi:digeranylgeranylglycerophospholipid reductase
MKRSYDIAIIGAGPSGLAAARSAIKSSRAASIAIFDKEVPWRQPIACAEGVLCPLFRKAIEPREAWIRFVCEKAVFHAPSGASISYLDANKGYIINRARMQKDLVDECTAAGVECNFNNRVVRIGMRGADGFRTIGFNDSTETSARVVIDCSGPLSILGKNERIHSKAQDLEVAYLAHVNTGSVDTGAIHIYAGKSIAPGGYGWAFPRTKRSVNAGIIIGSPFRTKHNVHDLFDKFMRTNFPDATIEDSFAGTIPCEYGRKTLAISGLIKAGDAASTVNPITRAGITEAIMSGTMAGASAAAMLKAKSPKELRDIARQYTKSWYEALGKRHAKLAKVKASLAKVPDSDYNKSAQSLSAIPLNELKMSKIFAVSLARFPRLVWALRHVL